MQNRALKVSGTGESVKKTYYFRDAQGNVLATYSLKRDVLTLEEIDIYGSSRLGLLKPNLQMYPSVQAENKDFEGKKNYELANHLGNVLAVISDRKKGTGNTSGNYAYFDAVTISATDYFPFGMSMPGRSVNTEGYRYTFNGKENDAEWAKQDYGARISDPRIGRFLSIDPLTSKYPFYSPYQFAGNMPIWAIDLDGLEPAPSNSGSYEGQRQTTSEKRPSPNGKYSPTISQVWVWSNGGKDRDQEFSAGWIRTETYEAHIKSIGEVFGDREGRASNPFIYLNKKSYNNSQTETIADYLPGVSSNPNFESDWGNLLTKVLQVDIGRGLMLVRG